MVPMLDKIACKTRLKMSPVSKISLTLLSFFAVMFGNVYSHAIAFFIFSFMTVHFSVSLRFYVKMLTLPYLFIIPGIIIIYFKEGGFIAFETFFRTLASLSILYFLVTTTTIAEIFSVFRKPSFIADIAMLMYRAVQILIEEILRIKKAQDSRLGYINIKRGIKSFSMLSHILFIKSLKRIEIFTKSMESRCYCGMFPYIKYHSAKKEVFLVVIIPVLIYLGGILSVRNF